MTRVDDIDALPYGMWIYAGDGSQAEVTQDGEDWVACCPPLDLYTQAESKDAAMDALKEAVFAWFESCLERHVLAKALEEVGFKLAKAGEAIPDHANIVHASPTHARNWRLGSR